MTKQTASPLPLFRSAYGFSCRLLLVSLLALFLVPAFLEPVGWNYGVETVLFTGMMLSALLAVSDHRIGLAGLLILLPPIAMLWLQHFGLGPNGVALNLGYLKATSIFLEGFAVWRLLRFVLSAKEVDAEALAAGVSIYLLLGLLWSSLYTMLSLVQVNPFKGELANGVLSQSDAFYFQPLHPDHRRRCRGHRPPEPPGADPGRDGIGDGRPLCRHADCAAGLALFVGQARRRENPDRGRPRSDLRQEPGDARGDRAQVRLDEEMSAGEELGLESSRRLPAPVQGLLAGDMGIAHAAHRQDREGEGGARRVLVGLEDRQVRAHHRQEERQEFRLGTHPRRDPW